MAEVHRTTTARAPNGAPLELIQKTVANPPEICVLWPFAAHRGYGKLWFEGRSQSAHRVALILYSGENPKHLEAAHGKCHNSLCINPKHSSWLTHTENVHDMVRDGTHQQGEKVYSAKITLHQVRAIRNDPRRRKIIAKDHAISETQVSKIKSGNEWSWVPMDPPLGPGLFS